MPTRLLSTLVLPLVLVTLNAAASVTLTGVVKSGVTPVVGSAITLYDAGNDRGVPPAVLGSAVSDSGGAFHIIYTPPPMNDVVYVTARGPAAASDLAAVLGAAGNAPSNIVVNELTTIASAWAMAQFMKGDNIGGKTPGLQNAAATVANMANLQNGTVGTVLTSSADVSDTSTLLVFNSLANLIAACVDTPATCNQLFSYATPPGGAAPADTLQAALSIAHNPWNQVVNLFTLSQTNADYKPALSSAPDAWTIALKYVGNGQEMIGPGNIAIDADGYLYICNNYEPKPNTCGGKLLSKLTPTGADVTGAPFSGGGVDGAGFGVTIDPAGFVWVGNFGFKGTLCPQKEWPRSNSVSKFTRDGTPLSPPIIGWTGNGLIYRPQGTVSDFDGNIWIANYATNDDGGNVVNYVTELVGGDPNNVKTYINSSDLKRAFAIAIDADNKVWITSNGTDAVIKLDPTTGHYHSYTAPGMDRPLGLAIDSLGNVWVANSAGRSTNAVDTVGSIVAFDKNGNALPGSPFVSGGIRGPWGLAIDGNDNVWVSNFVGEHLTELCGARPANCPQGKNTGDAISPASGYTSNLMVRLTATTIDQSGNVWVPNNWKTIPIQTNPGGNGLVEFVGLAAPVRTPMIGPPQQP